MLASIPASILNQSPRDLGIPSRFTLMSSRFRRWQSQSLEWQLSLKFLPQWVRNDSSLGPHTTRSRLLHPTTTQFLRELPEALR
jgi:hypothetical protein